MCSVSLWLSWPKKHHRRTENTEVAQRIETYELKERAEIYPTFRSFREFGSPDFVSEGAEQRGQEGILAVCSLHLALKPDRDSTTNRPSIVADEGQDLSVLGTRLRVQQVTRVENGFGPNRQSKTRQLLRDLNTQRGVVNT
jgi:hypothetical protein